MYLITLGEILLYTFIIVCFMRARTLRARRWLFTREAEGLATLSTELPRGARKLLATVADSLRSGRRLRESLDEFPQVFRGNYLAAIELAERTGALSPVLDILRRQILPRFLYDIPADWSVRHRLRGSSGSWPSPSMRARRFHEHGSSRRRRRRMWRCEEG